MAGVLHLLLGGCDFGEELVQRRLAYLGRSHYHLLVNHHSVLVFVLADIILLEVAEVALMIEHVLVHVLLTCLPHLVRATSICNCYFLLLLWRCLIRILR